MRLSFEFIAEEFAFGVCVHTDLGEEPMEILAGKIEPGKLFPMQSTDFHLQIHLWFDF